MNRKETVDAILNKLALATDQEVQEIADRVLKPIDLDAIKAEVWDEGKVAGYHNASIIVSGDDEKFVKNPYRKEETQ